MVQSGKPLHFESYFDFIDKYFSINVFTPVTGVFITIFEDISYRKIVESALFESENNYRTQLKLKDYSNLLTDNDIVLNINAAPQDIIVKSRDKWIEKKFTPLNILNKEEFITNRKILNILNQETKSQHLETKIIDNNWNIRLTETMSTNITEDNTLNDFLQYSKDITECKKQEETLKQNQRTLETLISNLPGVVYKCQNDPQWTMEFVSDGCFKLTGYQPEDLIMNKKISFNDLIHPDDRQSVWDTVQISLKEQKPYKITYKIITSDHKQKHVYEQGRGVFSSDGILIALEGFITDITNSVKNEAKIKKSEAYYKTIFENTGTATVIIEEDLVISLANCEFEKLSKYTKQELEGKMGWLDLIAKKDIGKVMKYHSSRKQCRSTPKNYEIKIINKDNEIRDVYVTVALIPYTNKTLISLLDITDKIESRMALKESKEKYQDLAELLPQIIFESDLEGDFTFVNHIGLKIFGYTQAELDKGMNIYQILDPEDHERARKNIQKILNGLKSDVGQEYTAINKEGISFPIIVYSDIMKHKNMTIGMRGVVVDVTELKKAENNIKSSLNEKNILLREIHHRVKNNLQIISSLLSLQSRYVTDNDVALDVLKESQNRVRSMAMIHEKLYQSKNFSHIKFNDYLGRLVSDLLNSYATKNNQIIPILESRRC